MQLKNRDGIACDRCGTTYKSDFIYYSFDFRLVSVYENRRQSLDRVFSIRVASSLDICTQCFDQIKNTVIDNYGKNMTADVRHRGKAQIGILCELSGEKMAGTFNFYHCNIIKVDVTMSGQPNICVKCQTKTYEENKPCKNCSGRDFVKPANTRAEDRFLEINICETTFHDMIKKAEAMRKTANEWVTQS